MFPRVAFLTVKLGMTSILSAPVGGSVNQGASAAQNASGVYTSAQAQRGKVHYAQHCAACHKADLSGASAPALAGDAFRRTWEQSVVLDLLNGIRAGMPPDQPNGLSLATYVDIVAYLLQANGFAPGPRELTADPDMAKRIALGGQRR
jgi:mono/diheme cytochrome c family protein